MWIAALNDRVKITPRSAGAQSSHQGYFNWNAVRHGQITPQVLLRRVTSPFQGEEKN